MPISHNYLVPTFAAGICSNCGLYYHFLIEEASRLMKCPWCDSKVDHGIGRVKGDKKDSRLLVKRTADLLEGYLTTNKLSDLSQCAEEELYHACSF